MVYFQLSHALVFAHLDTQVIIAKLYLLASQELMAMYAKTMVMLLG